jgi:hypothetical protein
MANEFTNEYVKDGDVSLIMGDELRRACEGLARSMAPYDTGNLAEAIYSKPHGLGNQGFTITYPYREVNYLYLLEFGSTKSVKNKGFIRQQTVPVMASIIEGYFTRKRKLDYKEFIANTQFDAIAIKKGKGSIGGNMTRQLIGYSRYAFADTQDRVERRVKSISQYNKMFYYSKDFKKLNDDSVVQRYYLYESFKERSKRK